MKFTLFSAVLFSIGWMSVVVTGNDRPPTCCLTVTNTRPPVENIVKYEIQESTGICAYRAVRFHTKRNIVICSDPDSKYAKRVMDILDGITTAKPTMCYTSKTDTIPTVTTTTTNKTPGTQTETSKSITSSRIVTTIETSRPETETSKTSIQPTSVPKENPESSLSTVTTCGKGGPNSPSTETRRETPGIGKVTHLTTLKTTDNTTSRVINKTSPRTTKLSKLIIRKRGKSKNRLRAVQMGRHVKNKPGKN